MSEVLTEVNSFTFIDCRNYVIKRISQSEMFIFDVKDGVESSYLVPYKIPYYVYNMGLMRKILLQVLNKLFFIYEFDNPEQAEFIQKSDKLSKVGKIYSDVYYFNRSRNQKAVENQAFYEDKFSELIAILGEANTKALCNMVLDNHIIPFTDDAREMLC